MSDGDPVLNPEALPLELFKYELPESLIAHHPVEPADSCRLMVAPRHLPDVDHIFHELPSLLGPKDLLVVNQTQVIPARVVGTKPTGGQVELLFERPLMVRSIRPKLGVAWESRQSTSTRQDHHARRMGSARPRPGWHVCHR